MIERLQTLFAELRRCKRAVVCPPPVARLQTVGKRAQQQPLDETSTCRVATLPRCSILMFAQRRRSLPSRSCSATSSSSPRSLVRIAPASWRLFEAASVARTAGQIEAVLSDLVACAQSAGGGKEIKSSDGKSSAALFSYPEQVANNVYAQLVWLNYKKIAEGTQRIEAVIYVSEHAVQTRRLCASAPSGSRRRCRTKVRTY